MKIHMEKKTCERSYKNTEGNIHLLASKNMSQRNLLDAIRYIYYQAHNIFFYIHICI